MIQPGLERIGLLLKNVELPWKSIHVAGTNGKGSTCMWASALLTGRRIDNGRFTSPHLINRWDCITINDRPVDEQLFRRVENHFIGLNERENIQASEFEILTATAFQIFNEKKVRVGVVEVGMGGKLDATNVLNNQTVSVITKVARDHQNFLGNSLESITEHKAGILRPNVAYIINPANERSVQELVHRIAKGVGAGPFIDTDTDDLKQRLYESQDFKRFVEHFTPSQQDNAVVAFLAVEQTIKNIGESPLGLRQLLPLIRARTFQGRFIKRECLEIGDHETAAPFIIDGAHNEDSARALAAFVDKERKPSGKGEKGPITWVFAASKGKDVKSVLSHLLRPGDSVVMTSFGPVDGMPWVKPIEPRELMQAAREVQPNIMAVYQQGTEVGVYRALCTAKNMARADEPIVLAGSLYLVGDFLREEGSVKEGKSTINVAALDREERERVDHMLSQRLATPDTVEMVKGAIRT